MALKQQELFVEVEPSDSSLQVESPVRRGTSRPVCEPVTGRSFNARTTRVGTTDSDIASDSGATVAGVLVSGEGSTGVSAAAALDTAIAVDAAP